MNEHRVVVTGLGAVTPLGIGVVDSFNGFLQGLNGIAGVTHFDVTDYRSKLAVEVKGFQVEYWIDRKSASRMDRFTQFAVAASAMACSTGSNAIGDALRIIQRGDADVMLAGSSEACISPLPYGVFCSTRSTTPSEFPENTSRPFDKNRMFISDWKYGYRSVGSMLSDRLG